MPAGPNHPVFVSAPGSRPGSRYRRRYLEPELAPTWPSRWGMVWSNLAAVLAPRGVRGNLSKTPRGRGYFRDHWLRPHFPARALLASVLWHIVIFVFPFPSLPQSRPQRPLELPRITLTYIPPPELRRDLPPLSPRADSEPPAPRPQPQQEPDQPPPRGADAYHPRQTIVSAPLRPTHPRQTLIQPDSPAEAPKILPPLPNIVEWNAAVPEVSRPRIRPGISGPRQPQKVEVTETAAPEIAGVAAPGVDFPLHDATKPQPNLPVSPMKGPRVGNRSAAPDAEAPEIAGGPGGDPRAVRNLIALSASPAPPAPEIRVPPGNLEAQFAISPLGRQPGVPDGVAGGAGGGEGPGGTGTGSGSGGGEGAAGGSGPPGIRITGGNPAEAGPVAGPARPARPLPARPRPRLNLDLSLPPNPAAAATGLGPIQPGAPPEQILGYKRIYTLHVNMPNLSSVTGSWVLRFAEMDGDGVTPGEASGGGAEDLVGPVPVRKVDPRYPPALAKAGVEGEVVLYAIIRADGSVDSIQVVKGLEPQLDQNAMEALARWQFEPARRNGDPVELEALISIPFRSVRPL